VLKVGVVAGEASGDTLGAGLISAIKERKPNAQFVGVAGPQMIEAGCEPWQHTDELSVMGLAEVVRHLPRLLRLRKVLLRRLKESKLDVFIGIDSPDFNLPVSMALKKAGVPTIQYVSPQIWAWRQSRVRTVSKAVDLVLCVLPFETQFYDLHGISSHFVGHPLADVIPMETDKKNARAELKVPLTGSYLALLPGSRKFEVSKLAIPFLRTANWLRSHNPELEVIVGLANDDTRSVFLTKTRDLFSDSHAKLFVGKTREVIGAADVVLTASGTASLESMLVKRPMVVGYKVSSLTYKAMQLLGLKQLDHFSLPNLLADMRIVPEYVQGDICPEILGPSISVFLQENHDKGLENTWYESFSKIHGQLRCNASERAADAVLQLAGKNRKSL
tara:strand:- start:47 stop:1213 length:1167 start_codon:yes stop_codon:yes gene_type:complete